MGRKIRPTGNPNGRAEKLLDWEKVDYMLECGCLGTEIAAYFKMHPNTFYAKIIEKYGVSFSEFSQSRFESGNTKIRMTQYEAATDDKNTQLMIWLGKNRLNQRDTQELIVDKETATNFSSIMTQLAAQQSKSSQTSAEPASAPSEDISAV